MNFLAHCALAHDAALTWNTGSGDRRGLLAGAFVGDFVKGPIPSDWPIALQAGARLHRRVDALSNVNPGIRQNCNRFPDHLRRFAPIFVDVLADHCLSEAWHEHYSHDLGDFAGECYEAIATHADLLPHHGRRFYSYMRDEDLLASYDNWRHVARGLHSVLRRLRREEWFEEVEQVSLSVLDDSRLDFAVYYPDLRQAWEDWDAFNAIAAPQSS